MQKLIKTYYKDLEQQNQENIQKQFQIKELLEKEKKVQQSYNVTQERRKHLLTTCKQTFHYSSQGIKDSYRASLLEETKLSTP
jgi:hypothetical protein